MVSLAIRRLRNRLTGPDLARAWEAGSVLDLATRSLPAALDAVLPAAMDRAGVPREAVVALRRLDVRVEMAEEPDQVARDWAAAIGASLSEALSQAVAARDAVSARGGDSTVGQARSSDRSVEAVALDSEDAVAFTDVWAAEAAVLRLIAQDRALPWWGASVVDGTADVPTILGAWIERDPARAAVALTRLAREAPQLATRLSPALVARLTVRLLALIHDALHSARSNKVAPSSSALVASAVAKAAQAWCDLPSDRRGLFVLATLIAGAPALSVALAGQARGAQGRSEALSLLSGSLSSPVAGRSTAAEAIGSDSADPAPRGAGQAVMHGGLLLLLRPLVELGLIASVNADELPALLTGVGLTAMQRLSAGLPSAARRTLLERDRGLLGAFAGTAPPDGPLDTILAHKGAGAWLDAVLAVAPVDTSWAIGAARRYFGGVSPFEEGAPDAVLARLVLRPARLTLTPWSADLTWPAADIALRRAGWDIDPGWLPWIGRVVRFHFDETAEP